MATEADGGYSEFAVYGGTAHTQVHVKADVSVIDDDTCWVSVSGYAYSLSGWELEQYGVHVQCGQNGSNEWNDTTAVFNRTAAVGNVSGSWKVSRGQSDKPVTCWTKYWGETVNGYGAANIGNDKAVYVTVTVPARPYRAHGNPSFSASKTSTHYGEEIKLSWSKSGTQGNADFVRFELYHDDANDSSNKLYAGTNTSMTVTPSDYTGAKGGSVTFSIWELHQWYGSNKWTHTDVSVEVKSGVVTVYDSSGKKHVGLVNAYDSSGNKHYVLITAYDSSGKAHNVV